MRRAVQLDRHVAFQIGGIAAVMVLLWWPASAYGSPAAAGLHPSPGSLTSCTHTALAAYYTNSGPASSRLAFGRDLHAYFGDFLTGAWAWAHPRVGYPDQHRDSQEQLSALIARTLHLS